MKKTVSVLLSIVIMMLVFAGCSGLASVSLSGGMSSIPELTLYGCSSLGSISIPGSVGSIGSQAFGNCSGLGSISIPASVSSIDFSAFDGCSNLAEVNIEGGNGSYASSDGAVYDAGLSQLLYCPVGKSQLTLPDNMTSIASAAFSNSPYVYSLDIPSSVTTIEVDAFTGSGIKAVTIPPTTTSIGSQSAWTPDVIRGYTGSQAERFADENGYIFESIGTLGEDPTPTPTPTETPTPDPSETPTPKPTEAPKPGDGTPTPGAGGNGGAGGTNGNGGTTQTGTGGSGGANAGTRTSVSRNMGTAQVGSGTPKTGVAFDARYVLCLGVFFAGGYLVISKKKKSTDTE